MDADAIRDWATAYDESRAAALHETEQALHDALQNQAYITQPQLRDVIAWKLVDQAGRCDRYLARVAQVPEAFVQRVSEAALLVDEPALQLKTLTSIPGIGEATATVILAFYDPEMYAVGGRYLMAALFDEDRQMRVTDYPTLLAALRDRNPGGFSLRTVQKAYSQRYRDRQDLS